jgi:hypothetical protein
MIAAATLGSTALWLAVVTQDQTELRAAPKTHATAHAQLWQGELLEVRGTRFGYLQTYDHRRERAGFVRASQVKALSTLPEDAPQLLAVLRFLRDTPGAESLGIAYAAAYLRAAPAASITPEPFDALGTMAERLARRAASNLVPAATLAAHIEAVKQYGVTFNGYESRGTVKLCYDGEAFRTVIAMASANDAAPASPQERARATLALTRHDCIDPALRAHERQAHDAWRAQLLERFEPFVSASLDGLTKNRLRMRRAGVWAAIAFAQSRRDVAPQAAAQYALDELAAVNSADLGDDDQAEYTDAAIRVGAVRWAAVAPSAATGRLQVQLQRGEPGQTCVRLVDGGTKPEKLLAQRCTYATVWPASARASADQRALALTVQPMEGWSELWVWRQRADGWALDVIPADSAGPGIGYVEFAGWVPGPQRKLLWVREARVAGRTTRQFEVANLETLATEKSAAAAQQLAAFGRWADPTWKRTTVSLR